MRRFEQVPGPIGTPGTLGAALLLALSASALEPLPGWPVSLKVSPTYSPSGIATADLDGDGVFEVAIGSTAGRLYVLDINGAPMEGWPFITGGRIQSKPAVADLDGDGLPELIVLDGDSGLMWALSGDGTAMEGWPVYTGPSSGILAPVVLKRGEGGATILAPAEYGLSAFSESGDLLWSSSRVLGAVVASPAAVTEEGLAALLTEYGFLYMLRTKGGRPVVGFPFLAGQRSSWGAPVLADLEGDGGLEVLYTTYDMGYSVFVYCLQEDGSLRRGFPVRIPGAVSYSSPVAADADGDGDLEVFLCCTGSEGTLWALDSDGSVLDGWPVTPSVQMEGSPTVADITGDGTCEVLAASGSISGGLYCYSLEGEPMGGLSDWGTGPSRTDCPVVADLNGDGSPELLLLTADGTVYAWRTGMPGGRAPWPQLHGDLRNTSHAE